MPVKSLGVRSTSVQEIPHRYGGSPFLGEFAVVLSGWRVVGVVRRTIDVVVVQEEVSNPIPTARFRPASAPNFDGPTDSERSQLYYPFSAHDGPLFFE